MRNREIVDAIFIKGLQDFEAYNIVHVVKIKIEVWKFIQKYINKQYIYRFIIDRLNFSSCIKSDATVLFIIHNDLTDAKNAIISGKIYKLLHLVYQDEILNWKLAKVDSLEIS